MVEALALVELNSIARGLRCVDVLVKRAAVKVHEANLVEPGKYLILFSGTVAEVEESFDAATTVADETLVDKLLLPVVHPLVVEGLLGRVDVKDPDCVGVVEARHVASVLEACDRSLKDADVGLCGLRAAGGLGGRAFYVVHGFQHQVEAALDAGKAVLQRRNTLHGIERIARPHPEFVEWLFRPAPFAPGRF